MRRQFGVAPWPRTLKVSSTVATALLSALGVFAYLAIPTRSGFTHAFGLAISLVFPLLLIACLLQVVSGYAVDGAELVVTRPLWPTRIPLAGLTQAYADPAVCKGSLRVFGNAGLFGYTGVYRNRKLGRYRLYATDLSRAVVLVLPTRTVVVTPEYPQAFVLAMLAAHPTARPKVDAPRT